MRKSVISVLVRLALWLAVLGGASLPGLAETVVIRRADGETYKARLAGNWDQGCAPTLILSPGLGGDERSLGYMDGPAVAEGFRVLTMEHRASGPRALFGIRRRGDVTEQLRDPVIWDGRARDLAAAIAYATKTCRPKFLALGGHSMGAALTMMEAGARGVPPYVGQQRFDAYIAVSPQGIGWAFADRRAWTGVAGPVLMMTGTEDDGLDGSWKTRLPGWRGLPDGQKRLAVLPGATHLNFGGLRNRAVQTDAAQIVGEFLQHVQEGWKVSSLDGVNGMQVTEK